MTEHGEWDGDAAAGQAFAALAPVAEGPMPRTLPADRRNLRPLVMLREPLATSLWRERARRWRTDQRRALRRRRGLRVPLLPAAATAGLLFA